MTPARVNRHGVQTQPRVTANVCGHLSKDVAGYLSTSGVPATVKNCREASTKSGGHT